VVGGRWVESHWPTGGGLWSVGLACLKGAGHWFGRLLGHGPAEIVQACIGVRAAAQQRSWRPVQAWGRSPAERRSCVCGLPPWQALGAWPSRSEIVQASAGLRSWPGGDHECLRIPGLAGLKG
jgi:hypothetical protein